MRISDDLTALVFELQRARSPNDKARAMARAWRTIRKLNPTERRLLAREVGFDGAEDLVEGLAGKSGGAFAPAAVLEALGRMRKDEDLSLRGILSDLKDPDRREDLLKRGIDLISGEEPDESPEEPDTAFPGEQVYSEAPVPQSAAVFEAEVPFDEGADRAEEGPTEGSGDEPEPVELMPPPPIIEATAPEPAPGPEPGPAPDPEPASDPVAASEDDDVWHHAAGETAAPAIVRPSRKITSLGESEQFAEREDSVLHRLRAFRDGIGALRGGGDSAAASEALEHLPEPWAKRRAVVALIESGIPEETAAALDLIEELDRPMDRRWCLSALARRGGLEGDDLERALAMLASPAARRRVRALAAAAN